MMPVTNNQQFVERVECAIYLLISTDLVPNDRDALYNYNDLQLVNLSREEERTEVPPLRGMT